MSKKKVRLALEAFAAGRPAEAKALLRDVELTFLRRRLNHYITDGDARQRLAASALWKDLLPHPEHQKSAALDKPAHIVPVLPAQPQPKRLELDQPEAFLAWVVGRRDVDESLDMETVEIAEVWALVGLGALCLSERKGHLHVVTGRSGEAARFAYAVGFNELITGQQTHAQHEAGRTVRLRRVTRYEEIDSTANDVSRLIVPAAGEEDVRRSIRYVLIELLRNVIQHSEDRAGGVVAAQLMNRGPYLGRPTVQVAVADGGIGIPEHVSRMHSGLEDPRVALERALWPHISGTFPQGLTGSKDNAGLGLFFIAEMAKRTHGRLLVASRGGALILASREDVEGERVVPRFLQPAGIGFPGTIVVFEIPLSAVTNYTQMNQAIHEAARARTPARAVHHWVRFEMPAGDPEYVRVRDLNENTSLAAGVSKDRIRPAVLENRLLVFDFAGIEVCTQSFLHALLYEAVRLAWAMRAPIYVIHADRPVRSGIEFLESYALGG